MPEVRCWRQQANKAEANVIAAVTTGGNSSNHAVSRQPRCGMCSSGQVAGTGRNHARQRIGRAALSRLDVHSTQIAQSMPAAVAPSVSRSAC